MAEEMGISEVTVKIHKRNAMKKMETRSLAEFVHKLSALGLCRPELKGGSEPLRKLSTCRRLWSLFSL
jgi:Bacterial regulatory proteins, luxR family